MILVYQLQQSVLFDHSLRVSRYSLGAIWCHTLADGSEVLVVYPSKSCDSMEYRFLGIAGTIIYTAGFPTVVGIALLYMQRNQLHNDRNWIQMFGFVYTAFEAKTFYYGAKTPLCSFCPLDDVLPS